MSELLEYARTLAEEKNYDQSYVIADKMLRRDPNSLEWLSVMTYLMLENEKPVMAYHLAKSCVQINPRNAGGYLNLGTAARDMRLDEEAERHFRRGLKYAADDASKSMLSLNLASSLIDMGRFKEAEKYANDGLKYQPDSIKARVNLGFSQLAQRNWSEGWKNYRHVIGHDWRPKFQYNDEPLWDGKGKGRIVVYGEQGLGDQISFASMLPDMIEWAKNNDSEVVLDVVPKLEHVMRRSFPEIEVHGTLGANGKGWKNRDIDYSIPIGQLGEYFRNSDDDFPGTPYLKPDPDRVLQWKALFESKGKPVVGVAWSGGIAKTGSKWRRVGLNELSPIFEGTDAFYVSLQYKPAKKEIEKAGAPVFEYAHATLTEDYDDTMAMVAALDAVVAVHTSVCHAAGALGVPCLTLVPSKSQWRYGTDETDFVWANSVELFRQDDGWPIDAVKERLDAILGRVPEATAEATREGKLRGDRPKIRRSRKRNNRQTGT